LKVEKQGFCLLEDLAKGLVVSSHGIVDYVVRMELCVRENERWWWVCGWNTKERAWVDVSALFGFLCKTLIRVPQVA